MMNNMEDILRQAQKMQAKVEAAKQELSTLTEEGISGGGMVRVTVCADGASVKKVHIAQELFQEEKGILEDLLCAAMNDALRRANQTQQEKLSGIAGLPGGLL